SAAYRSIVAGELRRNLLHLSADQRTCLELRFFHGLSLTDVARRMKRRPNAVSAIQVRALRTLRWRTSAHWPPPAS
ncbi:sigma factor-like helix-turn-helix DNA-binding protein, partial [Haloechinothrix salitolerans]